MIYVIKQTTQGSDSPINSVLICAGPLRILFALSETNWYTDGKSRKIPIWVDRGGLFVYKFAIRVGWKRKKDVINVTKEDE